MHGEASVCDPFDIPDADRQMPARDSVGVASSPPTPGLDVTGASISSATGEDGKIHYGHDASACRHWCLDMPGSVSHITCHMLHMQCAPL